jgi:hypothetical protein
MNNQGFLQAINDSFQVYLRTGSRSNQKLVILHGFIADKLSKQLGVGYEISSLGFGDEKERNIQGRYVDKKVDITISKNGEAIAGIAVKFVMSNYSQNSNNYFENMLGETANIRCNDIPYFQVLVLTQHAPYFEKGGVVSRIEEITQNNLHKYQVLSKDNTLVYLHSPDKTLVYIVEETSNTSDFVGMDKSGYISSFNGQSWFETRAINEVDFDKNIILNDFDTFTNKIAHAIQSI